MRFCLLRSDLKVVFKALKFVELVSSNMLAVTNVAICTNLALIIYVRGQALHIPQYTVSDFSKDMVTPPRLKRINGDRYKEPMHKGL